MIELQHGKVAMTRREFDRFSNYSCSLPTGTTPGKRWIRARYYQHQDHADEWMLGEYGEPYIDPKTRKEYVPITWRDIVITDVPRKFPAHVYVKPRRMR